jgi:adenosylcobyric acid synthase
MSNFTDFDRLARIEGVAFSYVRDAAELRDLDVVILPGSKNTVRDLEDLRARGIAEAIVAHHDAGKPIVGICGGLQMLGHTIDDPHGVEAGPRHAPGLALLDVTTSLSAVKITRQVTGSFADQAHFGETAVRGYEIHVGDTKRGDVEPLFILTRTGSSETVEDGAIRADGRVFGTYVHGLFDEPRCALAIINHLRTFTGHAPLDASAIAPRTDPYERLAAHFRAHVDVNALYDLLGMRVPA